MYFQSAAEKLTMTCSTNKETDLDKIVVSLNPEKKEFVVEPLTLQVGKPRQSLLLTYMCTNYRQSLCTRGKPSAAV